MNQNVLIVYATRAGSTVDVANAIGQTLAKRGFSVDVKPAKTHPSPKGYQAVLVGSAVRMGMWLPEAVGFLKTNAETLKQVPLALFSVHTSNLGDDPKSAAARRSYLEDVLPLVPNGVETAFFAGVIDPTRLSFLARMITRAVKSPVGDFRDWTKIDAWAQTVLA